MNKPDDILQQVLNCCNMDSAAHNMIVKAYKVASLSYEGKYLPSGEPFMLHHAQIAYTAMKEVGLGHISAVCALLHSLPVIEGDEIYKDIAAQFGENVSEILKGFYKIIELHNDKISLHSEAFRSMFLSLVDDIRVILLLLSHRLNDIRHHELLSEKDKKKFFEEIKYIYIPIAHRLGLYHIKSEMEERLMRYEMPHVFNDISNKIKETEEKRKKYIENFIKPIAEELKKNKIEATIKWRTKSVPSIWAKMNRQKVTFEEVYDLFAIRIIINSKSTKKEKEDCWRVYSIVTNIYQPNPKRLRDWITNPKASGYESLHTTVKGPENKWVEVQIRTVRMDEVAEKGQAAHWQYKGIMRSKDTDNWLSQIRDVLEHPEQVEHDALYRTKQKSNHIFVFTPKGDLKKLPAGATVLDFAYEIHTKVGAQCKGARINGKAVPIRHVLQNGDKVDVVVSNKQKPKFDWLAFVKTNKARLSIKKQLKEEKYKEAEAGKALLLRKIKNWKLKSNDDLINVLIKAFKIETSIDLYYLVATEKLDLQLVKKTLTDHIEKQQETNGQEKEPLKTTTETPASDNEKEDVLYIGENLKNVEYRLSLCCNPVPGDKVFGFITSSGGISIHRFNCPNAKRLKEKYPYRIIDVKWTSQSNNRPKLINLRITGKDELGIVEAITKVITGDLRVNMRSVNFKTNGKRFEGKIGVLISEHKHLEQLIHKLNQVHGVEKVRY